MTTEHRTAGPPTKASQNLTIQWGLVSIPVALYAALEEGSNIKRSTFTKAGEPVGIQKVSKTTGNPVLNDDIAMRVELDKDQWVDLTDDEITAVIGNDRKGSAIIESFVPLDTIGSTYSIVSEMQVRPQKGKNAALTGVMAKPFGLLLGAMADAKVAALMQITLRTKSRYGALLPDGRMFTLAFADECRAPLDLPETEFSEAERTMARQLIDAVGVDEPVLVNEDGEKLIAYVKAKAEGGEVAKIVEADTPAAADTSLEAMLAAAVTVAAETKAAPKKARTKKVAAAA